MSTLIEESAIHPGDVLLCYDSSLAEEMLKETGGSYSHAAVCIDSLMVAESCSSGVKKLEISELIDTYECVAAFRPHPGCWSSGRLKKLNYFINQAIKRKAKFNLRGFKRFKQNEEEHNQTITNQLYEYFNGNLRPELSDKGTYFCSELVAAAFYVVGILEDSAAIFYKAEVQSPAKLAQDPTFGIFLGHIKSYDGFSVPENDEFLNETKFHEIYPEMI